MQVKSAPLVQIKAGPDDGLQDGQFIAYASVFGNVDSYGDVVEPGAFTKTLEDWTISGVNLPVLWGHDMSDPFSNIGHVVTAAEDEKGLKVTAQLDLDSPKAAQVYRLLKGRRVNQMSFAYDVLVDSKDEDTGAHLLSELKLYEVSVVALGANQETEVLAVKSAAAGLLAKAGRVLSAKNESTLREAKSSLDVAAQQITDVLAAIGESTDQTKPPAGEPAKTEEPSGVKVEEPMPAGPDDVLAALTIKQKETQ